MSWVHPQIPYQGRRRDLTVKSCSTISTHTTAHKSIHTCNLFNNKHLYGRAKINLSRHSIHFSNHSTHLWNTAKEGTQRRSLGLRIDCVNHHHKLLSSCWLFTIGGPNLNRRKTWPLTPSGALVTFQISCMVKWKISFLFLSYTQVVWLSSSPPTNTISLFYL